MASLRAVAYPLVQEARRWPPPSLRLVWPVRLSVVVTWRRDPTSVCWPSFPPTVPPAGAPFPPRGLVGSIPPLRRYYETLRLLAAHPPALRCLRPAVPSEHLRFAPSDARCTSVGLGDSLRWRRRPVPGKPTRTHATRSDPGEVAASTALRRGEMTFRPTTSVATRGSITRPTTTKAHASLGSGWRPLASCTRSPALLHESELAHTDPDPQFFHRPMRYDIGLPSTVI